MLTAARYLVTLGALKAPWLASPYAVGYLLLHEREGAQG